MSLPTADELSASLRGLVGWQGLAVRSGRDFARDVSALLGEIKKLLPSR